MAEAYKPNGRAITDEERELLTILAEEAGEVIQAATKILRFGVEHHPGKATPNNEHLGLEIGEFEHVANRLEKLGTIRETDRFKGKHRKRERLEIYLQNRASSG